VRRGAPWFVALLSLGFPMPARAAGHGPLFGLSTPTVVEGAVELDASAMSHTTSGTSTLMLDGMVAYGLTPYLQASLSLPLHLHRFDDAPAVASPPRGAGAMPGDGSAEALVSWRFLHFEPAVAERFEATVSGGASISPIDERFDATGALAAGVLTRRFDLWLGAGYQPLRGDAFWSAVSGLRVLRQVVDLRLFGEAVGVNRSIAAGPSLVLLVRQWAFAVGALLPVRDTSARAPAPMQVALNVGGYIF
jgi:hypothetical protein